MSWPLIAKPDWVQLVGDRLAAAGLPVNAWHLRAVRVYELPLQRQHLTEGQDLLASFHKMLGSLDSNSKWQWSDYRVLCHQREHIVRWLHQSPHCLHREGWLKGCGNPGMIRQLQETVTATTQQLNALTVEETRAALCVLEAQTDLPAVLVNIVRQYVDLDASSSPYVSIYKQQ